MGSTTPKLDTTARRRRRETPGGRALQRCGALAVALHMAGSAAAEAPGGAPPGGPTALQASLRLDVEAIDALRGGIDPGVTGDAVLYGAIRIEGSAVGLPAGSRIRVAFDRVQGGSASASRIGAVQSVSNIEADARSRLSEVWYGQRVGAGWDLRAGLIAVDAHFDTVDSAGLLLNSSFGAQPSWSANSLSLFYPSSGVGVLASHRRGAWTQRAGLFQADPGDRSGGMRRGPMLLGETAWRSAPGVGVKLGLWGWRGRGMQDLDLPSPAWGGWVALERGLGDDGAPGAFVRAGWSSSSRAFVHSDLQAGVLLRSPLRPADRVSAGVARAALRGVEPETVYELGYRVAISRHAWLQPDLQYLRHPAGHLPDATVAMLRLHMELE